MLTNSNSDDILMQSDSIIMSFACGWPVNGTRDYMRTRKHKCNAEASVACCLFTRSLQDDLHVADVGQ